MQKFALGKVCDTELTTFLLCVHTKITENNIENKNIYLRVLKWILFNYNYLSR